MKRRSFSLGALAAGLSTGLAAGTSPARADKWPDGPIKFIVGYAPGGTSDVTARVLGEAVAARLNELVVIENRPGALGRIAIDMVVRAKPDGQTFLVGPAESFYQMALEQKTPVKAGRPLAPVTILTTQALVLAANPARGWKTVADVIAAAKAEPQGLSYATPSAGVGSNTIAAEGIFRRSGAKVMNVPYKGGGQAVQDLLSNVVPLGLLGSAPVVPYIQSGKLTLLAVTSKDRDPLLPDVPGMAELGYADVDISQWFALFAPPQTPKAIVDRMSAVLRDALTDPKVIKLLANAALSPVGGSPEDFTRRFEGEGARWLEAVRTLTQKNPA
jgi:tripartite-type tricarboxylate transporter receptor subunit TctC